MRKIFILLIIALLGAGGTALAAGPSAADVPAPEAGYGFTEGASMMALSQADLDKELDAASKTNAQWLRVLVDWSKVEPDKGKYDWTAVDRVIKSAKAHNLKVLANIAFTPRWARSNWFAFFTAPPKNPADLGNFTKVFAEKYKSSVSSYEIWNEPNLPLFFGWFVNAAVYTGLLKATYPAIKSVQPDATVVAAGPSRLTGTNSPPNFYQKIYAAGGKGFFDAAAAHPYVFPGGITADPDHGWSDVARIHDVMAANGDGAKSIWLTEFGAPTSTNSWFSKDGVSQDEQAKQIGDILAAAKKAGYVGPSFIYSIRDNGTNKSDREQNFGALLTNAWVPKKAATLLAK